MSSGVVHDAGDEAGMNVGDRCRSAVEAHDGPRHDRVGDDRTVERAQHDLAGIDRLDDAAIGAPLTRRRERGSRKRERDERDGNDQQAEWANQHQKDRRFPW